LFVALYSYYRRWNQLVSVRRPSLWHFIRRLKDEERHVRRSIHQARDVLVFSRLSDDASGASLKKG